MQRIWLGSFSFMTAGWSDEGEPDASAELSKDWQEMQAANSIPPAASVGDIKLTCLRGVLGPRTASMVLMLMDRLRADPPLHHTPAAQRCDVVILNP